MWMFEHFDIIAQNYRDHKRVFCLRFNLIEQIYYWKLQNQENVQKSLTLFSIVLKILMYNITSLVGMSYS
ncbi:hypothetical protein PRO82_000819 [Candidatus Protochlamydia amoebophila]|nr:hypothetical protein [Candidatus Protochlamydia amoebophila]